MLCTTPLHHLHKDTNNKDKEIMVTATDYIDYINDKGWEGTAGGERANRAGHNTHPLKP